MRIGIFTTLFPYKKPFNEINEGDYIRGGLEEVVYNLSLKLSKFGHEIYVFTTSADTKDHIEKYENITLFRYGRNFRIADTDISFRLLNGALDYDLDIVHLHLGTPPATLAALNYIGKRNRPFIVTHHLDPGWDYGSILRRLLVYIYAKYYVKKAFSESDVIIALSENYLNVSKFLCDYKDKIKIIPNGINLEEFDSPYTRTDARHKLGLLPDDKIILFVGSITKRKGPQILIEAMNLILKKGINTRLVLVGSYTTYVKYLEKLISDLHITSNVRLTGFINDDIKLLYYKSADVLVLPSFSEAFPMTLLEASAFRLPLVVSDLEAFKAIVDNEYNGLISKVGDAKDLSEKISYILNDDIIRNKMSINARKKVENYSWDIIANETDKIYRSILR